MRLLIEANNIVIKRLSALDSTAVCASVAQYFSPRKNIAMAINAPLHETIEVDQYRARVGLCQGLSLGAFETTSGRMIAFYINRIETGRKTNGSAITSDTDYFREKYEWVGPISRLSEHAKENIFRDTGVEKPLYIDFGAVDPKYSKHGISTTLSIMSEDVAKENGCDSIASFVTSSYTLYRFVKKTRLPCGLLSPCGTDFPPCGLLSPCGTDLRCVRSQESTDLNIESSVIGNNRKVVTRSSNNNHAFNVRRGKENVTLDDTENSSSSTYEVNLGPSTSWSYKGSLNLRLIIPVKSRSLFNFIKCEDGSHKLRSIRLREQSYDGLKTPIVSFGNSGAGEGLYNLRGTLDTNNDDVNHLHMVVVKECDEFSYTKLLPNHVLLVLPPDFDVLGRGAMKFAAQALFTHFYDVSNGDEASDTVWPFVMIMNDDCVAWSAWKPSEERISNPADEWSDISLKELLENVESSLTSEVAAVGFRPWSTKLTRPNSA
ncbi:uncharacterized protein LOC144751194 [Ciona intestinalis]